MLSRLYSAGTGIMKYQTFRSSRCAAFRRFLAADATSIPGVQDRGQDLMVIAMTCGVCDTRMTKKFSKKSYEKGVVLIRCPGCNNNHLIADNLGWFDEDGVNIEDIMKEKGEDVTRVGNDAFHLEGVVSEE